jgi:GlcNAc-P-P-Und epimerase
MVKRVLVTGCSGFIGQHLMALLAHKECDALGVDIRRPAIGKVDWSFKDCDILNHDRLCEVATDFGPDAVIHLAARTDLAETKDLRAYAANTEGTRNVIESMVVAGTVQRALFTSSQLVCRVGYVPSSDTDYCPVNLYGESKVLSEKIVRENVPEKISWCLLRPTTIWGEGMSPHYQRFLRMVRAGRYFHIGSGPLHKSYGYVGNAVYQYWKFLNAERGQIDKKTFYIADYEPLSLTAWVDALAHELGSRRPRSIPISVARALALVGDAINLFGWREFPFNTFRVRNILTEYVGDLSETEKVCGVLPFSVSEGVSRTARWYQELLLASPL